MNNEINSEVILKVKKDVKLNSINTDFGANPSFFLNKSNKILFDYLMLKDIPNFLFLLRDEKFVVNNKATVLSLLSMFWVLFKYLL